MQTRQVSVFIDMVGGYGRSVMRGISRYIRAHVPWVIWGDPERIAAPVDDITQWPGDGVIAMTWPGNLDDALRRVGFPVVNVASRHGTLNFPSVISDNTGIGETAASHLLDRGFRNFAYCGFRGHHYSDVRGQAFADAVAKHGFTCETFIAVPPQVGPLTWHERQAELTAWARSLPRPCGVLCCNDVRARHVAYACLGTGVRIPEDLALVGVDNDELVCDMSNPPLSSVVTAGEQVGYEAARLLDSLMNGSPPPPEPLLVPPRGVTIRRSSDVMAIADAAVAEAMRFIHDHAAEPIGVNDVVIAVAVSRRVLERRFRAALNRTIGEEIGNARIDRAKRLLVHSDSPTAAIAHGAGFQHVQQFNAMFKRVTDMTPTAYRRQFRSR